MTDPSALDGTAMAACKPRRKWKGSIQMSMEQPALTRRQPINREAFSELLIDGKRRIEIERQEPEYSGSFLILLEYTVDTILEATNSSGRIFCAIPALATAPGIPQTTLLASS